MILGIIMFGVFLILLAIGFPVSFAMILSTLLALLFGSYSLEVFPIQTVEGIYGYTLLAVPLFILAGNLMNSAGITQKIFDFCVAIIGFVRGGLAQVNILASVIFAGISGTAVGDQAGLGAIEMRAMVEKGYSKGYSAALVLGSSVIGGIIPSKCSFDCLCILSRGIGRRVIYCRCSPWFNHCCDPRNFCVYTNYFWQSRSS